MKNIGKAKKLLSLFLAVIVLLGSAPIAEVPSMTMKASAAVNLTSAQIKSYVESRVGQGYASNSCLAFVRECFMALGGPASTACCAYKYGNSYIKSNSKDNIPIGADVFFGNRNIKCGSCGNYCGHIGIYVGNGEMVHASGGKVLKSKLTYVSNYRGWGYHGGINIVDGGSSDRTTANLGDNFYAYIIKNNTWKHLGISNDNVCISPDGNDSSSPKQIWHFVRQSDNSYIIMNEYNGECLDAWGLGTTNETNVALCKNNGGANQRWFIYYTGYGYNIKASYCDLYLDSAGNRSDPGNNIQLYQRNNSEAQVFAIYHLTKDGFNYSKPAWPSKVSVNVSTSGNMINISWSKSPENGVLDSREYDVRIHEADTGKNVYTKLKLKGTKHTVSLNETPGKYYVTVAAVNSKYYEQFTFSDKYTFCLHSKTERITKQPTCNSAGNKTITCSFCNYSEVKTIPATGNHNYTSKITTPATCTTNGVKIYTCTTCGKRYTETIAKTGHKYDSGKVTKSASCTTNGVKTYTCSVCGNSYTETIAETGHKYDAGKVTKTPTCSSEGVKTYTCTACGSEKTEVVAKSPTNHIGQTDIRNYSEATCTSTGYTGDNYCIGCGAVIVKGSRVVAKGHTKRTSLNRATISKDGIKTVRCSVCGKLFERKTIARIKIVKLAKSSFAYTGKALTPKVTIKDSNGKILEVGRDYDVVYRDNKKIGKATVVVTFKGNYAGHNSLTFKIVPSAPLIKVTTGKKKADVKWGKVAGATNYTVYYSLKKNGRFKKVSTAKNSCVIKNLKPGKTYYFKVIANKKVGNSVIKSPYSKTVSVKIKK